MKTWKMEGFVIFLQDIFKGNHLSIWSLNELHLANGEVRVVKALDINRLKSRSLVYPFGVLLMSMVTLSNNAVGKQRLSQVFIWQHIM